MPRAGPGSGRNLSAIRRRRAISVCGNVLGCRTGRRLRSATAGTARRERRRIRGGGGDGEGGPAPHWERGRGPRSTGKLPPLGGGARLELAFEIPQANLPAAITVALNGRVVDRFVETRTTSAHAYDVEGKETQLVITTNRTVSPARLGVSGDTRELGLKLDRIVWLHVEHHTK